MNLQTPWISITGYKEISLSHYANWRMTIAYENEYIIIQLYETFTRRMTFVLSNVSLFICLSINAHHQHFSLIYSLDVYPIDVYHIIMCATKPSSVATYHQCVPSVPHTISVCVLSIGVLQTCNVMVTHLPCGWNFRKVRLRGRRLYFPVAGRARTYLEE